MDTQKALLVTDAPDGLSDLNICLQRGWRVVSVASMGGGGQAEGFCALVVIERVGTDVERVMEQIEGQIEETLGDGGIADLPPRLDIEFPTSEKE